MRDNNDFGTWAIGPFVKAPENPVLRPDAEGFDSWAAYNPAVIKKDGTFYMFYRAESADDKGTPYCGTSRIGLATSTDGLRFKKHGIILDADDESELPGGLEDPRICIVDGVYHLLYTAYKCPKVFLHSAVSTDLLHWKKLGPLFAPECEKGLNSKSACPVVNPALEAVKLNGSYVMYTNQFIATSADFVNWSCTPFRGAAFSGRRGGEVCTAVTDYKNPGSDDIVLFVAGDLGGMCPDSDYFYAVSECLMSRAKPTERIAQLDKPVIRAEYPYEKSLERLSGEAVKGTIFLDSIFKSDGRWYAYYGASDMNIGVAVCDDA